LNWSAGNAEPNQQEQRPKDWFLLHFESALAASDLKLEKIFHNIPYANHETILEVLPPCIGRD
jgi:hypothetical protein